MRKQKSFFLSIFVCTALHCLALPEFHAVSASYDSGYILLRLEVLHDVEEVVVDVALVAELQLDLVEIA